jgi:Na+-driven multidrug efflux pump
MRIISLAFIFAGLNIAFQGIFQALACGIESLIISIGRQVLFILPVAWIFVHYFITGPSNANLVWWTFMIGETITLILAVLMYIRVLNKKINTLNTSCN